MIYIKVKLAVDMSSRCETFECNIKLKAKGLLDIQ